MPEPYIDISCHLLSDVDADVTESDFLGLVFGLDGAYIPKAERTNSTIPKHYTADRSSLGKMRGVAKRLKQLNQQLMDINDDTIMEFNKEALESDLESSVAYYQPLCVHCLGTGETYIMMKHSHLVMQCTKCTRGFSPHICVNPAFLHSQETSIDRDEALAFGHPEWKDRRVIGDFALIWVTCHECAHDLTQYQRYHHGKNWKQWFSKFLYQIVEDISR